MVGAGSWGTTVAVMAGRRTEVTLWARRRELADVIDRTHRNPDYLGGIDLPDSVGATDHIEVVATGCDLLVMAVPSHGFREIYEQIDPLLDPDVPIVSLTKGIEQETLLTMTGVIAETSPRRDPAKTGVMTGPNLAAEVIAGQPTAAVVAMRDDEAAESIQSLFMSPRFRVYTNDDVVGSELAGALKNVMAIASGMSDGLGFGDNTRATLLTRALAEVSRLGVAMGGRAETFAGLAGMGDLIATCSSDKSRNHRVGVALAKGRSLDDIVDEMRMVAEGVKTTRGAVALAERAGVEMPIATHVGHVLDGEMTPLEGMTALMTREAKAE